MRRRTKPRRRRRISELRSTLNSGTPDAAGSYDAAIEYAELVAPPSEKREAVIALLSARRDVLKYGSGGSMPLSQSERDQLLQTLGEISNIIST